MKVQLKSIVNTKKLGERWREGEEVRMGKWRGPGLGKGGPKIHWELTTRKYFVFVCLHM